LATRTHLDPGVHVDAPRPGDPDRAGDGFGGEPTREDDAGPRRRRPRERPRDRRPGLAPLAPPRRAVQQERGRAVPPELVEVGRTADLDRLENRAGGGDDGLGRLAPVELHRPEPALLDDRGHVGGRVVPEHADRTDERRQRPDDRRHGRGRDEPRRALDEDEPEGVGPRLRRPEGVVEVRDAADLDADHRRGGAAAPSPAAAARRASPRPRSSPSLAAGSPLRESDSPTSTAWAPAARTRRTSAREAIPLSEIRHAPAGACGASRSVTARSVRNVARSRLLIPITAAPSSTARSSSASPCTSTSGASPSPFAAWKRSRSRAGSRMATISSAASAPCARASQSWYSSSTKSFSSTGHSTAARTVSRSSRLPWKCRSVRTESAAAPARTYSGARATGSNPRASSPATGEARLSSARTRTSSAARGVSAEARLRGGGSAAAAASSARRGTAARRAATCARLRATISSRRPMARAAQPRPARPPAAPRAAGARRRAGERRSPGPVTAPRSEVTAQAPAHREVQGRPPELLQHVLADRAGRREVPRDPARADQGLQEVLVDAAAGAGRDGPLSGQDQGAPARAAPDHALGARMLAALGDRPAVDLHDVEREVEDGGVGDRRPDPVGVDDRVEPRDLVLVDPARGDQPHVLEAAEVELPAHLLEDAVEVAPPRRRRVEPDRVEIAPEGLGDPDGLELLVLQGVDQRDPPHLGIHHRVERPERLHGVADHQHERVRDRAHRVGVDQLRRLRHRDAVAAAHERVPLDHRREPRVHPPGPEADDLALPGRLLAPRRLGRDPGGLAEQPEERGL